MSTAIRVFLIDDHEVLVRCVQRALSSHPDIQCIGSATCAEDAHRALDVGADVVLLDLGLPDRPGMDLLPTLVHARMRVVVYSGYLDALRVGEAMRLGAAGYVTKTSATAVLVDAIRAVHRGEAFMSGDAQALALEALHGAGAARSLSRSELRVVRDIALTGNVKRSAERLGLSPKTVATHLASAYKKLGFSSHQELFLWARRAGVVE
jgi:two-component system, NarL family, invasion response regulator UvrY